MDEVKSNSPTVVGVMLGIIELNGVQGIGIQIGAGSMMIMTPDYADALVMQIDLLLSQLEDDGSEPLDPEEEQLEVLH